MKYQSVDQMVEQTCSPALQALFQTGKERNDILNLLEEVRDWMVVNQYNCEVHGGELFMDIIAKLKEYDRA